MKKRYILFGYQIQNGEFCIVQQEGAAVEYIFDAYSNGDSLQQIATHMSSCGPPYRSSDNRWNKNIIARLLSCDIYCGTATYPAIITKELYSLPFQDFGDSTQCFLLRIRLSCSHPAVKALLADWRIHRTAFENGRITSSDYLEWMLQWPPTLSAPDD